MSSLRKLQQEIEKTLKKVQEGLEVFDDHQEQYDTTDPANTNAREKLESQVRLGQGQGGRHLTAWCRVTWLWMGFGRAAGSGCPCSLSDGTACCA